MKTMTESTEEQESGKKPGRDTTLVLSVVVFAIVCAISAFLFFENMRLASSIEANKNEVSEYKNSIEKIKGDKKVIAAELVANNRSEILGAIKASEVQTYIDELIGVSKKYKMIFSGFAYKNGKITTAAVSMPETVLAGDDGVKKISNLVRDYRTGTDSLFQLSPVLSVSGYEQKRTFSVEFNVAALTPTLSQR